MPTDPVEKRWFQNKPNRNNTTQPKKQELVPVFYFALVFENIEKRAAEGVAPSKLLSLGNDFVYFTRVIETIKGLSQRDFIAPSSYALAAF